MSVYSAIFSAVAADALRTVMMPGAVVVQVMSIAVFLAYAVLLYLFSGEVNSVVREIKSAPGAQSGDSGNRNYLLLNWTAHAVGVCAVSVFVCRILFVYAPGALCGAAPKWLVALLGVAVTAVVESVMMLQRSAVLAAGYVTQSDSFARSLLHLRKIHFTMFGVIVVPVMLLYSSFGGEWDTAFLYTCLFMTAGVVFVYLWKSCVLFVGQKISILYWFLYLCTVELFPISLVISILLRII